MPADSGGLARHFARAPELIPRFREWLGRDPHPTGARRDIIHIHAPRLPQFRFEWHPRRRIVYLIRVAAVPPIGEAVALNIETHADAINGVLIWCRGFNEGAAPGIPKPNLQV